MGKFKINNVEYCTEVKVILKKDKVRSSLLELKPKTYTKVGSLIRDKLFKPISSPLISDLGFDGDVEGVDVEPKKEEKD